jgi:hypothetical protein
MTATTGPVSSRGRGLKLAILALLGAFVLVLAACGSGGSPIFQNVGTDLQGDESGADRAPVPNEATGGDTGGDSGQQPYANLVDRQIVKTGEVTVEVPGVAAAVGTVRAMALQLDGYVGASQSGGKDEAATLTLRIPADRFDDAITRLHDMDGDVTVEATREEDVTGSVVDLDARIRNLQASEAQYRTLLAQAQKIDDILTVQARLDEVRGQIEQLQAQLDQLSDLAKLATLTVTLVPSGTLIEETTAGWDAGDIFEGALAALVTVGQGLATVLIWLVIVGLPLAVLLGIGALLVWRFGPGLRRRPAKVAGE